MYPFIENADYAHAKRVYREYHDLYAQSHTLFLADVFEKFRNMCIKIYKRYPSKFLPSQGLSWEAALKETKVKADLSTCIDISSMIEKGGIHYSIINMQQLITNT